MPDIKDSVGAGGSNKVHDVAMVQMMLRLVKNAKGTAYFSAEYNGTYTDNLKTAITAFQIDQKLIEDPNAKAVPAAKGPAAANTVPAVKAKIAATETAGLIKAGSQTLANLSALIPAAYKEMRIIEGTKTLYLPMSAEKQATISATIGNKADLDHTFRNLVQKMHAQMYENYKITLSIPADGWRRSFADQAKIGGANTGAGPGESNHQYGKAVDIGFNNLVWIKGDGTSVKDNFWLTQMPREKSDEFWAARDKIAIPMGLFRTNLAGDIIHLQAYSDTGVSYARSLASLLNAVKTANQTWVAAPARPNQYKTDFGLGGATYSVGSARQIWAGNATVNKADLLQALNAKLKTDNNFDVAKFFGFAAAQAVKQNVKGNANAKAKVNVLTIADIKEAYVNKAKDRIKENFVAADTNWTQWKAVK